MALLPLPHHSQPFTVAGTATPDPRWYEWLRIFDKHVRELSSTEVSVAWDDISGKPTTFQPSSHTHPWSQVTSTPTTLGGYGITDAQPLDSDLTAIAALSTTTFGRSFLTYADEAAFKAGVNLEIGVDVQAYDADLAAIAAVATTSFGRSFLAYADEAAFKAGVNLEIGVDVQAYNATLAAVAGGTYTGDDSITTLGTVATGTWQGSVIAVAYGGTGAISASGTALDNITGFSSTGHLVRTGSGSYAFRTITGTAGEITVTNGDGVSGNPTILLPSSLNFAGKGIAGGNFTAGNYQAANAGLHLLDTDASSQLTIVYGTNLSANRNLTLTTGDADRNISLAGDLSITGNFTTAAALSVPAVAQGDIWYGSASGVVSALAKNTSSTRYLSNTGASNNPTWAQVDLTNGVTGDLPFANLAQGSALSVLGVTGNATADVASIAAGTDHQVLRRSGTSVAFGAVNLAQSAAVTGTLPVANGGTGDTGTAWTSYTPIVTAGSGSFTSVSATGYYKTIGRTVFLRIVIIITTNGTAGDYIQVTAPVSFQASTPLAAAREDFAVLGAFGTGATSNIFIRLYDGTTYPGGDGRVIVVGGVYEERV